jgi:hypothetical protein
MHQALEAHLGSRRVSRVMHGSIIGPALVLAPAGERHLDRTAAAQRGAEYGAASIASTARIGNSAAISAGCGRGRCLVVDAAAVLIAVVTLGHLPVGPSVGAVAVVLILGSQGVAAAAAAGVLMTVTGTVGGLCFAAWAGGDRLWSAGRRAALGRARARRSRPRANRDTSEP